VQRPITSIAAPHLAKEGVMDLPQYLTDERLHVHLLGLLTAVTVILIASLLLRLALKRGGEQLAHWTGLHWLDGLSREVARHARAFVLWSTLGLVLVCALALSLYHVSGQDLRHDFHVIRRQITAAHLLAGGILLGKLAALGLAIIVTARLVRRLRLFLEMNAHRQLCQGAAARDRTPTVCRWFLLLERYVLAVVFLGGVWVCDHYIGFSIVDDGIELLLRVLTILTAARLLTLGAGTLSQVVAELGTRHLGRGPLHRYWERVTRLFPFGERCFELAVYVSAASLCVRQLEFIAFVASYGAAAVKCIAIFFGTRVLIELLHVFLNQAFGAYEEDAAVDQRRLTLVPLLQSLCQYVLYVGSALMMLHEFGIETTPILAGAGILGLACGLGAQSLVTDVVSGFFILFENQYLVGDIVQVGDALGRVEAVSIRHTQIRDEQGKLYIIPNGQIKTVINYSKGYVNAVVDVKVATSANLEQVLHDMAEAGRRLRQARREVLGETIIKGLVDLTPSDMVVRAVTKVQPGTHLAMQLEYRRLLKEVFEQSQAAAKTRAA
jgi:small conductance mechanosensitive channel